MKPFLQEITEERMFAFLVFLVEEILLSELLQYQKSTPELGLYESYVNYDLDIRNKVKGRKL